MQNTSDLRSLRKCGSQMEADLSKKTGYAVITSLNSFSFLKVSSNSTYLDIDFIKRQKIDHIYRVQMCLSGTMHPCNNLEKKTLTNRQPSIKHRQ